LSNRGEVAVLFFDRSAIKSCIETGLWKNDRRGSTTSCSVKQNARGVKTNPERFEFAVSPGYL
jgi:hypothetical protein